MLQARAVGDRDTLDCQGLKNLDRVRAAGSRRDVMVAGQDHDRQTSLANALDAFGELSLVRRVRSAAFIHIAGDQYDIGAGVQAHVDRLVQPLQVIDQARVQASRWVDPAMVFHADVQVGQVQQFDHIGYRLQVTGYRSGRPLYSPITCHLSPSGSGTIVRNNSSLVKYRTYFLKTLIAQYAKQLTLS